MFRRRSLVASAQYGMVSMRSSNPFLRRRSLMSSLVMLCFVREYTWGTEPSLIRPKTRSLFSRSLYSLL